MNIEIQEIELENKGKEVDNLQGGFLCGIGTCSGIACGAGCPVSAGSGCGLGCNN